MWRVSWCPGASRTCNKGWELVPAHCVHYCQAHSTGAQTRGTEGPRTRPSSGKQPLLAHGLALLFMKEPHSPRMTGNLRLLPVTESVYPCTAAGTKDSSNCCVQLFPFRSNRRQDCLQRCLNLGARL